MNLVVTRLTLFLCPAAQTVRAILLPAVLLIALWQAGCGPVPDRASARGDRDAVMVRRLEGRIEKFLAVLPQADLVAARARASQALTSDIANGATVSLIEADSGKTVSTAVSSTDGTFNIAFPSSFVPEASRPYVLEAVKGLAVGGAANRAGAPAARVRTLVAMEGGAWQSLSGSGVVISRATTALCIIAGHRELSGADRLALLGKVSDPGFAAGGTAIAGEDFERVLALVTEALGADQDPVEAIGYFAAGPTGTSRYARKGVSLVIQGLPTTPAARGAQVVIGGQNLPAPGPATPAIFIGDIEATTWTVNAMRTRLTLSLPPNAVSGHLRIVQGATTWYGPVVSVAGTVGTIAGSGDRKLKDGIGRAAAFNDPWGLDVDSEGNIYVADIENHAVRSISPQGFVTTMAGDGAPGDRLGKGSEARFRGPYGLRVAPDGSVFVADLLNNKIKRIARDGSVTWFSGNGAQGYQDGPPDQARFNHPVHLIFDAAGNLLVTDMDNKRIRKVTPQGVVSSFAGDGAGGFRDGPADSAEFNDPVGLALGASGEVYVGDGANHCIRLISGGTVSTFAGAGQDPDFRDGQGTGARFKYSYDLIRVPSGDLFVADARNYRIRRISPSGFVSTVAGSGVRGDADGLANEAQLNMPFGITADAVGNLYVTQAGSPVIRIVTP